MKSLSFIFLLIYGSAYGQIGYQIGEVVSPFTLTNVDGVRWSPASYPEAKGFIIVFTALSCPYAQNYYPRLQAIHEVFAPQGYPLILISSNDPQSSPEDSFLHMQAFALEQQLDPPFLFDEQQEVARAFGATRTPQVFLLNRSEDHKLRLAYIGAIDDDARNPQAVANAYLTIALEQLLAGEVLDHSYTRAAGCGIKWLH